MAAQGSYIKLYDRNIKSLYNTPGSMVSRDLKKRAIRVQMAARTIVGKDSGRLMTSIKVGRVLNDPATFQKVVKIGSDLPYALFHHEGTRPHVIKADPGEMLVFTRRGRVIYTDEVHHPGTRGRKYLTRALIAARDVI